eukprot:TRINITY_DN38692_c0_g1_i1.p2 TRINITY_DN38692_c0_g1~~TRINITY_DN38692_c0_g1_i1.p2  ORF type:complete len:114 (-),score=18.25 TRINITY_DN38692_c0_g1_i1:42-383(-)
MFARRVWVKKMIPVIVLLFTLEFRVTVVNRIQSVDLGLNAKTVQTLISAPTVASKPNMIQSTHLIPSKLRGFLSEYIEDNNAALGRQPRQSQLRLRVSRLLPNRNHRRQRKQM